MTALVMLTFVAAGQDRQAGDDDLKAIQGSWKMIEIQSEGEKKEIEQETIFTFGKDTVDEQSGSRRRQSRYRLDPSKKPKHMDTATKRGGEMREFKMIYIIEGDILKICSNASQSGRPTKFSSKDGHMILVFRRFERE
jgi:uncharacterized protein (TIGR03067 family)